MFKRFAPLIAIAAMSLGASANAGNWGGIQVYVQLPVPVVVYTPPPYVVVQPPPVVLPPPPPIPQVVYVPTVQPAPVQWVYYPYYPHYRPRHHRRH